MSAATEALWCGGDLELGDLGAAPPADVGTALNGNDWVVGQSDVAAAGAASWERAFLWKSGQTRPLDGHRSCPMITLVAGAHRVADVRGAGENGTQWHVMAQGTDTGALTRSS